MKGSHPFLVCCERSEIGEEKMAEIQRLQPRHIEIMRRLCLGEHQRDIANDLMIDESRLSVIVNSPLFKLELRRMQRRREDQTEKIINNIFDTVEKGTEIARDIVTKGTMKVLDSDGKTEVDVPVPLNTKLAVLNTATTHFIKLSRGRNLEFDEEDEDYEQSLMREVTVTEKISRKVKGRSKEVNEIEDALSLDHPLESLLESAEVEAMDNIIDAEVVS